MARADDLLSKVEELCCFAVVHEIEKANHYPHATSNLVLIQPDTGTHTRTHTRTETQI